YSNDRVGNTVENAPAAHRSARGLQRRHQRHAAREQSRKHAGKIRYLILQPYFAQQRQRENDAVDAFRPAIGFLPLPEAQQGHHHRNPENRKVSLGVVSDIQHDQRDHWQLRAHILIELGKLRHHVRDQKHQHQRHDRDQQRRIHQRNRQLLLEGQRHFLERDVAGKHFFHVAALLARHQSAGIDFRKSTLARKRVGQQLPGFDPVAHILQQALQIRIALPLDQQIQRIQNRQPGFDQGKKLRVEDKKLALLDLAAPSQPARKNSPRLDPIHQETLLHKAVANLGLGVAVLDLLQQVPALVRDFDYEFRHVLVRLPSSTPV